MICIDLIACIGRLDSHALLQYYWFQMAASRSWRPTHHPLQCLRQSRSSTCHVLGRAGSTTLFGTETHIPDRSSKSLIIPLDNMKPSTTTRFLTLLSFQHGRHLHPSTSITWIHHSSIRSMDHNIIYCDNGSSYGVCHLTHHALSALTAGRLQIKAPST